MQAIDILIVNYNSTEVLKACIRSIYRNQDGFAVRIFVWDNHSTDHAETIKTQFPTVDLTLATQNIGFSAGVNRLLKKGDAPVVVILNPDCIIMDGFFQRVADFLIERPTVGVVGPKILNQDESIQGSARAFPTPLTSLFGRNSPLAKIFPNNTITKANILTIGSDGKTPMVVDWVSGACMVVRRMAIEPIGGFDERFFLYWEDTDLCRRIKDTGREIIYLPAARVIHIGGKSSNSRPIFSNFHFHKSSYRLYAKYTGRPYSALTPIAGMALMLRFLIAATINYLHSFKKRLPLPKASSSIERPERRGKIRVLRIISRMNIGGPSIHVKNLTENMNPDRFVTRLLTGSVSAGEGDMSYIANFGDGIRVQIPELQREISPYNDLIALLKVIIQINRFNPDIVHSHTSKAGTLSRLAVAVCTPFRQKRLIAVHTYHGHVMDGYFSRFKSSFIRLMERLMATKTDTIIAISTTQKWELSQKLKIAPERNIATIGLGFDLFPFVNNLHYKGAMRRKLNVGKEALLIGIVGRMVPIKNHRMFLDAARILLDRCSSRKMRFVLVGGGELEGELKAHASKIGIIDHTTFYGWEKNIPMLYADLDILTLTSLNEGTPVSIIEAMAASVPIVTTGVGGIKDLLGKYLTRPSLHQPFTICERGILCPKDDPGIFADALNYLVESDYLKKECRLDQARAYVLKHYSMERLLRDVERLYERLVA